MSVWVLAGRRGGGRVLETYFAGAGVAGGREYLLGGNRPRGLGGKHWDGNM